METLDRYINRVSCWKTFVNDRSVQLDPEGRKGISSKLSLISILDLLKCFHYLSSYSYAHFFCSFFALNQCFLSDGSF